MKDYEKMVRETKNFDNFQTVPSQLSQYVNAGWRNPGDDLVLKNKNFDKTFKYDVTYRDDAGKKYHDKGEVKAENTEQARVMVEYYPKALNMKKIWVCIYVFKKMEIFDGNGM